MAKLKLTKTSLKKQRDDLKRFQRFLPTLELKKEQLIVEMRRVEVEYDKKINEELSLRDDVNKWVELFAEPVGLDNLVLLTDVVTKQGNIAGVYIPVFIEAKFDVKKYDLLNSPLWIDRGVEVVKQLATFQAEREILSKQKDLLQHELRLTIQRINLFDKVKIPECRESIRKIRIYLGDQDANAVARGKIAKTKLEDVQIGTYV